MPPRIYLVGSLRIEAGDLLLEERMFPGRQARLAFAYLASRRRLPIARDELAEVVWSEAPPPSWDTALSAIISNLRSMLAKTGLPRDEVIANAFGCYQLHLPLGAWIDLEVAADSLDRAEGAIRAGDLMTAYGWAGAAASIARRPFLAGEAGVWIAQQRGHLHNILLRALDCLRAVFVWNGELMLAERAMDEAVRLDPFRETSYQQLMRVHAAAGNRAEAIRTYERCRRRLADELGVDPSPQTETVYLEILKLS